MAAAQFDFPNLPWLWLPASTAPGKQQAYLSELSVSLEGLMHFQNIWILIILKVNK